MAALKHDLARSLQLDDSELYINNVTNHVVVKVRRLWTECVRKVGRGYILISLDDRGLSGTRSFTSYGPWASKVLTCEKTTAADIDFLAERSMRGAGQQFHTPERGNGISR